MELFDFLRQNVQRKCENGAIEAECQSGLVAEPTYKYGAEAFEARQEEVIKAMNESMTAKSMPVMVGKKR